MLKTREDHKGSS